MIPMIFSKTNIVFLRFDEKSTEVGETNNVLFVFMVIFLFYLYE